MQLLPSVPKFSFVSCLASMIILCSKLEYGNSDSTNKPNLPNVNTTRNETEKVSNTNRLTHSASAHGTDTTEEYSTQSASYSVEMVTVIPTDSSSNGNRVTFDPESKVTNALMKGDSVTKTYDVLSSFPKPVDPNEGVNLTILPVLAILAFLVMLCLKGCTWFRESMKDRDSIDADSSFVIVQEGDKEYNDIDFRSDLSTPYDTYSSYMSFLRRNNNYDTVTSVRSLQGSRPYDTVTSYRSLILQRLENPNSESVTSYRAFLQRVKQMKDVEIQVELMDEKPKLGDRQGNLRNSRRLQRSNSSSPKMKSKHGDNGVLDSLLETSMSSDAFENGKSDIGVENGAIPKVECVQMGSNRNGTKRLFEKSPTRQPRNRSPVRNLHQMGETSPSRVQTVGKKIGQQSPKVPRFRVSFVTDNDKAIDVIKASNIHLLEPEEGKLSPTFIKRSSNDFLNFPYTETSDVGIEHVEESQFKDMSCGTDDNIQNNAHSQKVV